VVAHWGAVVAHWWEQWWLIGGSSGGSLGEQWWLIGGAVVAHWWEQWWLIGGSSGGSLVATPDCKLQSWVQIQQSPQPTVDCLSFDGLPSGMALCCRLSCEGRQRSIYKKHQKQLRKNKKLKIKNQNTQKQFFCQARVTYNFFFVGLASGCTYTRTYCFLKYAPLKAVKKVIPF
jgi:hypothetical protein